MTHDISRANYHVKHLDMFAKSLEDVCNQSGKTTAFTRFRVCFALYAVLMLTRILGSSRPAEPFLIVAGHNNGTQK